jgi:serine protease
MIGSGQARFRKVESTTDRGNLAVLHVSRIRVIPLLALALLMCGPIAVFGVGNSTSRWIVVYKSHALKKMGVQRRGGRTRHDYEIIPGYAADLTTPELDELRKDPSVASVEPDAVRHTYELAPMFASISYGLFGASPGFPQIVPYGIDMVHARDAWPFTKGAGIRVADIDTGIDLTHPDLPNIVASATFTSLPVQDSALLHGTHTAGTIAAPDNSIGVVGVAPQAGLLVAQVFDSAGNAYDSDIIAAIQWAVNNGAKVINMSLGGTTYDGSLDQACANAVAAGVVLVAAAGNSNSSAPSYPGAYTSVISVAAIDQTKTKASFSNFGPTIAVCAPGVGVLSSLPVGTGSVIDSNWNGLERKTELLTGSAYGIVTVGAVYCGIGNPSDFPASVRGKIAHIRRGTLTFAAKVSNAVAAGAIGVIISNNTTGTIGGTLNGNTSVVVVGVSQADGDDLQSRSGATATIINEQPADYALWDGTSMACPHVTGVATLLMAARHGNITPAQVRTALQTTAQDLGAVGRDDLYGYGLVDAGAALRSVVPVLTTLSESPGLVEGGDPVTVTVGLSTSAGLLSVKANGTTLAANAGVWTGNVPASSVIGSHTVDVVVTDTYGNVNHNTSAAYTTARTVAANGRTLNAQITSSLSTSCFFKVFGTASQVTASSFVVDDRSGFLITVNAAGHTIHNNDFVQARGTVQKVSGAITMQSVATKVSKLH